MSALAVSAPSDLALTATSNRLAPDASLSPLTPLPGREDILRHAYKLARINAGASGVDGVTFAQMNFCPTGAPAKQSTLNMPGKNSGSQPDIF
jgi:hypothetical protein